MNNDRRQQLVEAGKLVSAITDALKAAIDAIENVRDDEQEALDAMPEGLKAGERGEVSEAAIAALEGALDDLNGIDTAAVAAALEEAADRDVPADTVTARVDGAAAEERRWARLPAFAKRRIAMLEEKVEQLQQSAAAPFPDPTGAIDEIVVADYIGDLDGKALPVKRIAFPAFGIVAEVRRGDDRGVHIMAERALTILPQSGNVAIVKSERW